MNPQELENQAMTSNNINDSSVFFTGYASMGESYFLVIRKIFNAYDRNSNPPKDLIDNLKSGKQTVDLLPPKYIMQTEIFAFDFEEQKFVPQPGAIEIINSSSTVLHQNQDKFYAGLSKKQQSLSREVCPDAPSLTQ